MSHCWWYFKICYKKNWKSSWYDLNWELSQLIHQLLLTHCFRRKIGFDIKAAMEGGLTSSDSIASLFLRCKYYCMSMEMFHLLHGMEIGAFNFDLVVRVCCYAFWYVTHSRTCHYSKSNDILKNNNDELN